MDTTERMMIMGMCLQGLLANPALVMTTHRDDSEAAIQDTIRVEIARNVKLAHLYANALEGPTPQETTASVVARLTLTAYEVLRAADADGAGKWLPFNAARASLKEADMDNVDGVFERVSRWFHDPVGFPETIQDRIIAAVVATSR